MNLRFQLTATRVRVMGALLLAYAAFIVLVVIWVYAKMLSNIEVAWQTLGDPVEKALFLLLPFVILGLLVGSAGLLFLKSWARPLLLLTLGVGFLYGLDDFVREPNVLTPLFYAVWLAVFVLVARSKPYLIDREPTHGTH